MKIDIKQTTIRNLLAGIVVGMALAPTLVLGADKANARPAEADLLQNVKKAFINPKEEPGLPRVLLIGDSISIGYTVPVRQQLQGKAVVFRAPVNCQHTGFGLTQLKSWLGTNHWDVIHFNWGIWDTHYLDAKGALVRDETKGAGALRLRFTPQQYGQNLSKLVEMLEGTGAKLIWASTTPVMSRKGARFEDISNLNTVAEKIMKAHKIPINDLYTYTLPQAKKWQNPDQVHFNSEGVQRLGERVSESILAALKKN